MTRADVPWIAISGRKGGSALAGATVNALAILLGEGMGGEAKSRGAAPDPAGRG